MMDHPVIITSCRLDYSFTDPNHVHNGDDEVGDHRRIDGHGEEEVGALHFVDGVARRRPEEERGRDEEEVARRHDREGGGERQARDLPRRRTGLGFAHEAYIYRVVHLVRWLGWLEYDFSGFCTGC